jgi:hypothetical protein
LLVDVQGMCMSWGDFFKTLGRYQQALSMYEFTLVCASALEGHDCLARYHDPHLWWRQPPRRRQVLQRPREGLRHARSVRASMSSAYATKTP